MKRNKLHNDPNDPQPPHSKAMMSYPLGKPNYPEPEIIDVEDKESIDYYIDLAKGQPGKKLAIISKKTGAPLMGIKYDGSKVKISSGVPAMKPRYIKEGVLKKTLIDKIYSIKHPPKFTQKDLPPDVELRLLLIIPLMMMKTPTKEDRRFYVRREEKKRSLRRRKRR